MLDRRGVEIVADPCEQRFPVVAVVAEHADLDELVRQKIDVDLMQDRWGQTVLSYRHDRMERVRLGAAGTPLRRC